MASVLISGAGPIGLTMANELARYGVSVRIVDKAAARTDKSKALVLWMTGRRRWNPAEYADLRGFLQGVIDSLLSHSAGGYDNRGAELDETHVPAAGVTPETELLDKERAGEMDETLAAIVRDAQDDVVVIAIIQAIYSGAVTRRDIVRMTGRTGADIDNGLKRLRRLGAASARQRKGGAYEHQKA